MIGNKDVYSDYNYHRCNQFINCAECVWECSYGCIWFENGYEYDKDDKLPMIKYEYYDDQK